MILFRCLIDSKYLCVQVIIILERLYIFSGPTGDTEISNRPL